MLKDTFDGLKLEKLAFIVSILNSVLCLFTCFLAAYLSTLIKYDEDDVFSKYERFFVVAISLFMIIPFGLSSLLIYGVIIKHKKLLLIWIILSMLCAPILCISTMASGIFLAIRTNDVASYCLIGCSIYLTVIMVFTIMITFRFVKFCTNTPSKIKPSFYK